MRRHKIVWGGRARLQRTDEYRQQVQKIRASVEAKWRERLAQSGPLKRWLLRLAMEREIAREIQKLAPSDALYLVQTRRPRQDDERAAKDWD